ncbi:MAG: hypothetical protein ACKO7Q_09595 [Actinomycetota bacterium]
MAAPLPPDAAFARSFDDPDEAFDRAGVAQAVIAIGETPVKRAVYPAGWRHAEAFGDEPCWDTHVGYCAAGRLRVWWPDGTELVVAAGDAFVLPPGHDAECLEECVLIQIDSCESARERFVL